MPTDDQRDRLRARFAEDAGITDRLSGEQAARIAAETGLPLRAVERFALGEGIIPERYDRNIGTLGADGQRRLLESCVIVVGLGGLGGHVVEVLARLGVGRIVGVDPDTFVESNLNRQLLCDMDSLGKLKTEQGALRVARVNPAVEFVPCPTTFDRVDDGVVAGCDIVFDCLDGIEARLELVTRCEAAGRMLVHGAIAGWSGQVGLVPPGSGLLEQLYAGQKRGIEKRLGNLPFTAAVAASLMVAAAVPVLLGRPPSLRGLQLFDLLNGEWQTVAL